MFHFCVTTLSACLEHYGYWVFFVGIFLESFGLPTPGETLLVVGGIFAAQGHFDLSLLMLLGFISAVLGDNIGYAIGFFGGRKMCIKHGGYFFLNEIRLRKLEMFFEKYGSEIVIVARFIGGLRQFNGIIAGIGKMRWRKFLFYNIIGAVLWVISWLGMAYLAGNQAKDLAHAFKRIEYFFFTGLLFFSVFFIAYKLIKKKIYTNKKSG
jgi:membrane protein DedA with SNARE-associated domain